MASFAVVDGECIEEEWFHIIVEGFVVEEELRKEAQILAEDFAPHPIHLKDGEVSLAIDFIGWRVEPVALGTVAFEDASAFHVLEAELADVELWQHGILLGIG